MKATLILNIALNDLLQAHVICIVYAVDDDSTIERVSQYCVCHFLAHSQI